MYYNRAARPKRFPRLAARDLVPAPKRWFTLTRTTMSDPRLPPEITDYIVDHLHDQPETLKECCLVSKSWIPRVRTHLFGEIVFPHMTAAQAWKSTFPDPTNSPVDYSHSLSFCSLRAIIFLLAGGSLVRTFRNVTRLSLRNCMSNLLFRSI